MSSKKRFFYWMLCAVLLAVIIFSVGNAAQILLEYRKSGKVYRQIEKLSRISQSEKAEQTPERNFDVLLELNPDTAAWISIPGTSIDYPVVQGEDNSFYLRHMITGEWNNSGSIFLDARCSADFSDPCSILYGHNMDNGTMFSDLLKYRHQAFYDEHPAGFLETPDEDFYITFFSGFTADSGHPVWDFVRVKKDFSGWAAEMAGLSCFQSDAAPAEGSRLLLLSTCSDASGRERFVLLGTLSDVG